LALRTQVNGQLRMACLPALAHALVPHALQQLARALPSAGVRVDSMESPWLEQATSEQRYDLALSETTQAPAGVDLQPLLQANEVAVLPAAHPLSRRRVLRAQDFAGQRFISLAADDPYRHAIDAWFVQSGIERLLCLEASSAVAVCAMVRQGLGLAIVNPLTALECCGAQLVVRPLEIDIPFRVSLLLPTIVAPHPQRDVMVQALIQAARWVEATASKAGHTKT
jgi:DNA-binding transcriptional LysR family regulator